MRNRITATNNKQPIYSCVEEDWVKCTKCHKKLFKAIERNKSKVEIKCRCGSLERMEV